MGADQKNLKYLVVCGEQCDKYSSAKFIYEKDTSLNKKECLKLIKKL